MQVSNDSPVVYHALPNRAKVDASMDLTDEFRRFVGNYQPELSLDASGIQAVTDQLTQGLYPESMVCDAEYPHFVLASYAQRQISRLDASLALVIHRLHLDYPTIGIKVAKLVDDRGEWTEEARRYSCFFVPLTSRQSFFGEKPLTEQQRQKMLEEISQLPRSQQIFYYAAGKAKDEFPGLALQAQEVFLRAISHSHFGLEPRLGLFTARQIVQTEIDSHARLFHVPCVGVPTPKMIHGREANASHASAHDRVHWEVLQSYSPQFVNALLEVIVSFQTLTQMDMSKEIWEVGDFVFPEIFSRLASNPTVNQQFELFAQSKSTEGFSFGDLFGRDPNKNLFGWNMILLIAQDPKRWQLLYNIDVDQISSLRPMNELLKLAAPYLEGKSTLEKIRALQTLDDSGFITVMQVRKFFELQSQSKVVPQVTFEKVREPAALRNRVRLLVDGALIEPIPAFQVNVVVKSTFSKMRTGLAIVSVILVSALASRLMSELQIA